MTPTRRRFLAIVAASAAVGYALRPARAEVVWRGAALGAEAGITLRGGDPARAEAALAAARGEIARIEALFSLHRPDSALARLNAAGRLDRPDPQLLDLLRLCGDMHAATGGRFDPTVQPLWALLARHAPEAPPAADLAAARARVGWAGVTLGPDAIRFANPGMALTLNGIAQGHAADRVAATLETHGFAATLVDMGELRAGAGTWRVGIVDPAQGLVATRTVSGTALATSSPGALRFGPAGPSHVLDPADPARAPRWSSVTVEADAAAVADALSTAGCLMDAAALAALRTWRPDLRRVTLVTTAGAVRTL